MNLQLDSEHNVQTDFFQAKAVVSARNHMLVRPRRRLPPAACRCHSATVPSLISLQPPTFIYDVGDAFDRAVLFLG